MAPAVARELSVTYGTFVVGGSSDSAHLDGLVKLTRSYLTTSLEFDAVVQAASASAFVTACDNLEQAYRKVRQLVTYTLDGNDFDLTGTHSGNTAMNSRATVTKLGSEADTGRSRRYSIRIEFDTPADDAAAGIAGRVGAREILTINPAGIKRLRLVGVYTAVSGTDAKAQYDASIAAYATAALARAGITTSELILEAPVEWDDHDTSCSFDRSYRELIVAQKAGTTDDTDVFNSDLVVARAKVGPGDTDPSATRLLDLRATYKAWILRGVDMRSKWANTLMPHVVALIKTISGGSTIALVESTPVFHDEEQRLEASLRLLAVAGGKLVAHEQRVRTEEELGEIFVPVWTGNPFARDKYQGPATQIKTVITVTTHVGDTGEAEEHKGGIPFDIGGFGIGQGKIGGGLNSPVFGKAFGGGVGGPLNIRFDPPRAGRIAGGGGEFEDQNDDLKDSEKWHLVATFKESFPRTVGVIPNRMELTDVVSIKKYLRADIQITKSKIPGAGLKPGGGQIPDNGTRVRNK